MNWRRRAVVMISVVCLVGAFAACSDDDDPGYNGNDDNGDAGTYDDAGEEDAGEEDAGEEDAGEEDAGEEDAGEEDAGEEDAGDDDLTYDEVWADLDGEYGCGGCHGGIAPELAEADDVIGVASECDGTLLVDPGNPEDSLLWQKITPDVDAADVCGGKMPQGAAPADAEDADMVYDWIADGAAE